MDLVCPILKGLQPFLDMATEHPDLVHYSVKWAFNLMNSRNRVDAEAAQDEFCTCLAANLTTYPDAVRANAFGVLAAYMSRANPMSLYKDSNIQRLVVLELLKASPDKLHDPPVQHHPLDLTTMAEHDARGHALNCWGHMPADFCVQAMLDAKAFEYLYQCAQNMEQEMKVFKYAFQKIIVNIFAPWDGTKDDLMKQREMQEQVLEEFPDHVDCLFRPFLQAQKYKDARRCLTSVMEMENIPRSIIKNLVPDLEESEDDELIKMAVFLSRQQPNKRRRLS